MRNLNWILLFSAMGCQPEVAVENDEEVNDKFGIPLFVTQLVAGKEHNCALFNTGGVKCWGAGYDGKLGYKNNNMIGDNEHPSAVGFIDLGGIAIKLDAGNDHTCAILNTGGVRCWGNGLFKELGYPNLANGPHVGDDETPASVGDVPLLNGKVIDVAAGSDHTCALLDSGYVRCWGNNWAGQLGYANKTTLSAPGNNVSLGGKATQIVAGRGRTCALMDTGHVRCWGLNDMGQLGYKHTNNIGDNEHPGAVGYVDLRSLAVQLTSGGDHACALMDTGVVRCWGSAGAGALGYGDENLQDIGDNETPGSMAGVPIGGNVVELSAQEWQNCALLDTGAARCWGQGLYGAPGYGNEDTIGDDESPESQGDILINSEIAQVANGSSHTCVLLESGGVRCWGLGWQGQLGYANKNKLVIPPNTNVKLF